ncbi:hypothetical protein PWT90_11134 [Aphanocladium album]|nr:hypothetical protein PWT90_11134 [Aphanocladium album]
MHFSKTAISFLLGTNLAAAQGPGFCYCPTGIACSGATPQCTVDNTGATICCASGKKAINGKCADAADNACSDGRTVCTGGTPQCTPNVSVYVDSSGGAVSNIVCCPNGYKALNGKCFPGAARLLPCYQNGDVPCDFGQGYYCAWNGGNADSKCCKLDEYYNGGICVKKP